MENFQTLKERMYSLVEEYRNRTETKREFLESRNLKESQFSYWLTKYNREKGQADINEGFLRLRPSSSIGISSKEGITIDLPNGITVSGNGTDIISAASTLYRLSK